MNAFGGINFLIINSVKKRGYNTWLRLMEFNSCIWGPQSIFNISVKNHVLFTQKLRMHWKHAFVEPKWSQSVLCVYPSAYCGILPKVPSSSVTESRQGYHEMSRSVVVARPTMIRQGRMRLPKYTSDAIFLFPLTQKFPSVQFCSARHRVLADFHINSQLLYREYYENTLNRFLKLR